MNELRAQRIMKSKKGGQTWEELVHALEVSAYLIRGCWGLEV